MCRQRLCPASHAKARKGSHGASAALSQFCCEKVRVKIAQRSGTVQARRANFRPRPTKFNETSRVLTSFIEDGK